MLTTDELQLLIGISADPKFLQQVTYITLTHDERILQIDTCRAYHSGPVRPYPSLSIPIHPYPYPYLLSLSYYPILIPSHHPSTDPNSRA
jgi:hypothetical protein